MDKLYTNQLLQSKGFANEQEIFFAQLWAELLHPLTLDIFSVFMAILMYNLLLNEKFF